MSKANPRFHRTNPSLPAVGSTNGVVLYRILGSIEGQLTITTFYYSAANNNPTQTQLATLLLGISGIMFTVYKACLSADWVCVKETLDVVHRQDISGVAITTNANAVGARPAGHEPTEVAMVFIRYSAVKGQHGRGRIGIPAVSTADVLASRTTGAAIGTAQTNLVSSMTVTTSDGTNTWTPCIAQRLPASPKLVVGFSPVTRVVSSTLLGTVRRRKLGRGK